MEELERNQLLKAVLIVESIVFIVAIAFIFLFGIDVLSLFTVTLKDLIVVMLATIILIASNFFVVYVLPKYIPFFKPIRKAYDEVCGLVINADWFIIIVVAVFSGIAEEFLFRGAIQQQFGIVVASLVFGFCHIANKITIAYGLYAIVIGFFMGALLIYTGSLIVPMLVHIINNAVSIPFMQWNYRRISRFDPI